MYKYYFVIPIAYCIIFFVFLFNYISDRHKTDLTWGELSITVRNVDKNTEAQVLPPKGLRVNKASLRMGPARMSFGPSRTITANGEPLALTHVLPLSSGKGFSLVFSHSHAGEKIASAAVLGTQTTKDEQRAMTTAGEVVLTFQANEIFGDDITMTMFAGENTQVRIPFRMPLNVKKYLLRSGEAPAGLKKTAKTLSVKRARGTYLFRVLGAARFEKIKDTWELHGNSAYEVVRYGKQNTDGFAVIDRIPTMPARVRTEAEKAVREYVYKAYRGWVSDRYDETSGTYLQPDGVYGFSEDALAASFAESVERGEFTEQKFSIERAAYLHQSARTWRTAPLRFDSPELLTRSFERITAQQNSVRQSIQANNYDVLLDVALMETAHVFFDAPVQNTLVFFIKKMPPSSITPEIAVSLLIQSRASTWDAFIAAVDERRDVLEQIVVDNITVANKGYLLRQRHDELNIFFSVLAGRYLSQFAKTNQLKNLGYRMIVTALSLSDEVGFLPAMYVLKNKTTVPSGFLTPEVLYPWITDNPHYPRVYHHDTASGVVSVLPPPSENAQILVLANVPNDVSVKSNRIDIDVSVIAREATQYVFVIQPPRPNSVYAFNAMWSGEYFINAVSQGIYYDDENNILVAKISGQNKIERISLLY